MADSDYALFEATDNAMTPHSSYSSPKPGILSYGLLVAGLMMTVLTLGSEAAGGAGQGQGGRHRRAVMAEPADSVDAQLPLGDLPRTVRRARRVIPDPTALQGDVATGDDEVDLNLFNDVHLRTRRRSMDATRRGGYVWKGTLLDMPGDASIAVQNGVMAGTIVANDKVYEIRYRGNGEHEVREIDPSQFPTDDPERDMAVDVPDTAGTTAQGTTAVAADSGALIDVMVLWTPKARTAAGGVAGIQSLIDLAVANANTAYANSGVTQRIRLVYSQEVNYTEAGIDTDLSRLTIGGDGFLDEAQTLRDQYGADLVSLIGAGYAGSGSCGLGYMMSSPSAGFAGFGFTAVDQSCAASNLSLAHELGHNMGLNHDPANSSGTPAFSYAYGYQDPAGLFRTVMAYPCGTGACPRIMRFSNPNLTYSSKPLGTATQNAALALNNTASTVANFRAAVTGSCSYTISPTSATVVAAGGSSTLAVTTSSGCAWTATSSQSWLTITSGAAGTASGTVSYSAAANTAGASRSAVVTVGGKTLTVTQTAAACSYSVSSTTQSMTSAAGTFSVAVTGTTGCGWTAASSASWITVSSGASGTSCLALLIARASGPFRLDRTLRYLSLIHI